MARRISAATVEAERTKNRFRYAWDKWSDGGWWEATQGEDFTVEPSVFARIVNNFARHHGMGSETTVVGRKVRFRILEAEKATSE